jgi:hypothetical protein
MTAVQPDQAMDTPRHAQVFFWINAVVAWLAVAVSFALSFGGYYVDGVNTSKASILGNTADGVDTVAERFFDWITYFTILSNLVVAVVMTMLIARPGAFARRDATGAAWRALRLDSLLMIMITGLVYNLLLVEGGKTGWDLLSNTLLHWVVPLLTPIVWIIAGPRGLISFRTVALAMILPVAWAGFAIVRGLTVGAYPYSFLDVSSDGLGPVIVFIAVIMVVAVALALILMAVDAGLRWTLRTGRRGANA